MSFALGLKTVYDEGQSTQSVERQEKAHGCKIQS